VAEVSGAAEIRVHDDGPGMPETDWTVLQEGETPLEHGSGVGLWVIYWSMAAVGGEVAVGSRDPTGSTLTLTAPVLR
jgi:sensor histidine kinase regulating citrate/malate metabolism